MKKRALVFLCVFASVACVNSAWGDLGPDPQGPKNQGIETSRTDNSLSNIPSSGMTAGPYLEGTCYAPGGSTDDCSDSSIESVEAGFKYFENFDDEEFEIYLGGGALAIDYGNELGSRYGTALSAGLAYRQSPRTTFFVELNSIAGLPGPNLTGPVPFNTDPLGSRVGVRYVF